MFAFLEFRSVVETTNALALDGLNVQGSNIRVNRCHEYEPVEPALEKLMIPAGSP